MLSGQQLEIEEIMKRFVNKYKLGLSRVLFFTRFDPNNWELIKESLD